MLVGLVAILIVLGATFHFALGLRSDRTVPNQPAAERVVLIADVHR
jgi:hypothetical protein